VSREKALAGGQELAEAGMTDACVIEHRTGESTGAGGVITVRTHSTLYTGKCQVQTKTETGQGVDVGEAYVVVNATRCSCPCR
jgi:hypothetical protein